MTEANVHADIAISCGKCMSVFSSGASYAKQVSEIFNNHYCFKPLMEVNPLNLEMP